MAKPITTYKIDMHDGSVVMVQCSMDPDTLASLMRYARGVSAVEPVLRMHDDLLTDHMRKMALAHLSE